MCNCYDTPNEKTINRSTERDTSSFPSRVTIRRNEWRYFFPAKGDEMRQSLIKGMRTYVESETRRMRLNKEREEEEGSALRRLPSRRQFAKRVRIRILPLAYYARTEIGYLSREEHFPVLFCGERWSLTPSPPRSRPRDPPCFAVLGPRFSRHDPVRLLSLSFIFSPAEMIFRHERWT